MDLIVLIISTLMVWAFEMPELLHIYDLSNELAKTRIILRQHFIFMKQTINPLMVKMKNNHISLPCLDKFF